VALILHYLFPQEINSLDATLNNVHKKLDSTLKILLVEDDRTARDATSRFLQHCGHEVSAAPDAPSALKAAARQKPDVLVCDCNLGNKRDGIDLAREIQGRHGCAVIFVTAYAHSQVETDMRDIDVSVCMRKPISLPELASGVSTASVSRQG
jgi:CheY-like chemotaxis protein